MRIRLVAVALFVMLLCSAASADPLLQLYIQGGSYDASTDTWTISTTGSFNLWVIANVAGPGGKGTIYDVKLTAAYAGQTPGAVSLSFDPTTTGGYNGFADPSLAGSVTPMLVNGSYEVTDGSIPKLYDGSYLPDHGEYGSGTFWQEFALGNLGLKDSPCADFSGSTSFPSLSSSSGCMVSVYTVTVSGTGEVHFDLFDHVQSGTKAKVRVVSAPYSHDAEATITPVPEPTSMTLLGTGLAGFGALFRRRRRKP